MASRGVFRGGVHHIRTTCERRVDPSHSLAGRVNDRLASCATSGERKLACRRLADRRAGAENPIRPLYLDFRRGRLREKDWPWPSCSSTWSSYGCSSSSGYGGTIEPTRPSRWSRPVTRCRSFAVRWNVRRY
jgi:hypothetical protein